MMNRRKFLKASAGFAVMGLAMPRVGFAQQTLQAVRGSLNAEEFGIRPGAAENQGKAFAAMLERASAENLPIFLPPGIYTLSDIDLPARVRLFGVSGATRLVNGGGALLRGRETEHIALTGIVLDGAGNGLADGVKALLDLRGVRALAIDGCEIVDSASSAVALERAAGRIEHTAITRAADVGIYSIDAAGLLIDANTVTDCDNGGILVHRTRPAPDGTRVTNNRIARIRATFGGTGQHGNGINTYQAHEVAITGNHVSDCAFSAIRSNGGSNAVITGNHCLRSGETALYSEFSYEGAVIGSNIVDGAANGISMVNFNEGGRMAACTGNIVRNLSRTGPYEKDAPGFGTGIAAEADTTVIGNVIENAPVWGIEIGWGPFVRNVIASGNVIRRAGTGIAVSVVEGGGAATITDNIIEAARDGAIVGHRWAEPVTGDLALRDNPGFPHLTVARNRVS
ncbi:TIGR03808 family TAT-translocated repetitive protein [Chelativorans sp. AA-79]|uniref:TIGR03808 family TAT-translocated repetitive protein n=1 Tax=Chelativorans sp. AA-79 TaxID=3028735 RepID=UPI0023F70D26|nr:TIGR03808 family TAT-translocated repetitive protein [Chelativorans sp. AA-79]WEX07769.1 TIGR03808 family TAT-translocated repetitive protein [Chelativorans sp. AA-79]